MGEEKGSIRKRNAQLARPDFGSALKCDALPTYWKLYLAIYAVGQEINHK